MDGVFLLQARAGGGLEAGESRCDPGRPVVRMRRFASGQKVFEQGRTVEEIHELVHGTVLLVSTPSRGRRQIVDLIGPGRLFGFTNATRHRFSAISAGTAMVCSLDLVTARRNPTISERLERDALAEIDRLRTLAVLLGRRSAIERVASFLAAMIDPATPNAAIDIPITRGEIADHLGLSVEAVSRQLSRLERAGALVRDKGRRVRIVDRSLLVESAAERAS